ncbi:MAG TPA: hypothetical protein VG937_29770 [Polyangiaceae bacterium]|nr:hypothetical protein [Polyangiaceae bacterium]
MKGSPGRIERLVRWHYSLALRDVEGRDPRVVRILRKIEAELERLRGRVLDNAPIKTISSTKKSAYTLAQLQRGAQSMIELLTPIANGQPPGHDEQTALAAGLKLFGFTPGDAWIVVVAREIERERRRMLRAKLARIEGEHVKRGARAVLGRVRDELRSELPPHVDIELLTHLLEKYSFHSKGGRRDATIGHRRAIAMLRSGA